MAWWPEQRLGPAPLGLVRPQGAAIATDVAGLGVAHPGAGLVAEEKGSAAV